MQIFYCLFHFADFLRDADHFTDHETINFSFTLLEGQNKHQITPSASFDETFEL